MKQQTLAMAGEQNAQCEQFKRPTHCPKPGAGRPPVSLGRMLGMSSVVLKVGAGATRW
jgi:hypothetical protein